MHCWHAPCRALVLAAAFVLLTGAQTNGCDPGDPGGVCANVQEPDCPDGVLEPGGADANGCPLPSTCVPVDPCQDPDCQRIDPPDPDDLCSQTGGEPYEWCEEACWNDGDGDGQPDPGCQAEPICWRDCDCGWDGIFEPAIGCMPIDPGDRCEQSGGQFGDGWCACPWGLVYDEWAGCVPDPWLQCESSGGRMQGVCAAEDDPWGSGVCWDECVCEDGYIFDSTYGCYPGPELLCDWSDGRWQQQCDEGQGEPSCWDDCACPDGLAFDDYAGCVPDWSGLCADAGGEWTVICDPDGGSCWEDCLCPAGAMFDWVSACVGTEDCTNGLDDDRNGLIDCDDPMCAGAEGCPVVY